MDALLKRAALVHRHGRHVELHAEPTAILWLRTLAAAALGDGSVHWLNDEGGSLAHSVHAGAILTTCRHPDGMSVLTGGDDGRVCRVASDGEMTEIGRFERKWVEHLVASPASGLIVAGVGREAVAWSKCASEPKQAHRPRRACN